MQPFNPRERNDQILKYMREQRELADRNTTVKYRGPEAIPAPTCDLAWAEKTEAAIRNLPTTFEGDAR